MGNPLCSVVFRIMLQDSAVILKTPHLLTSSVRCSRAGPVEDRMHHMPCCSILRLIKNQYVGGLTQQPLFLFFKIMCFCSFLLGSPPCIARQVMGSMRPKIHCNSTKHCWAQAIYTSLCVTRCRDEDTEEWVQASKSSHLQGKKDV